MDRECFIYPRHKEIISWERILNGKYFWSKKRVELIINNSQHFY